MYARQNTTHHIRKRISVFLRKQELRMRRLGREQILMGGFFMLFGILVLRLGYLQIWNWAKYRNELSIQHSSKIDISAKRWNIYAYDTAWKPVPLATNADVYTLYADPKFIWDAARVSEIITPALHSHFCETRGLDTVTKEQCITNIENFTKSTILPRLKVLHYATIEQQSWDNNPAISPMNASGLFLATQVVIDQENVAITQQRDAIINAFTREEAMRLISDKLISVLSPGKKSANYLWLFESPAFLEALQKAALPYIDVQNAYYISIIPGITSNIPKESLRLSELLKSYGYDYSPARLTPLFSIQDTRYVKITDEMNATIAQKILTAKNDNYTIQSACPTWSRTCEPGVPLLHWLGLEKNAKRYYPLGTFAANVLGYTPEKWQGTFGVEQYYETLLKGTPWQIRGLSTPWIGAVGSNDVSIVNPVDGGDVYLTIDPYIQKHVEGLIAHYLEEFSADSISILITDPYSGNVVASANAPTFDPNKPQESYALKPLSLQDAYIVDDDTRVDVPVYFITGDKLKVANYDERKNPDLKKFVAKNLFGAQVFVDKNIAFPYEPGSIIKPFTVSAGLDNDEISLYDFYPDPKGEISIDIGDGQFQYIRNADQSHCLGTNTFLHALIYSCNIGMVRIAQKVKKEAFYNYMEKFGFGQLTNIELAWEDAWYLDTAANAGLARFFNNAFGQGFLATPMQIATAYSILVNGGYYVKPRIVDKIYDPKTKTTTYTPIKIGAQILKKETSDKIKEALREVIYGGLTKKFGIPGYTLGGKTGTSQISFKWQYRSGNGWTNASLAGMVTKENLKYVVVIQVRRPRSNQFGEYTAGKVFSDVSKLLIEKDLILK